VASSLVSLGAALLQDGDLAGAEAAHRGAGHPAALCGDELLSVESLLHLAATLTPRGTRGARDAASPRPGTDRLKD
jgi:hypothetical protein